MGMHNTTHATHYNTMQLSHTQTLPNVSNIDENGSRKIFVTAETKHMPDHSNKLSLMRVVWGYKGDEPTKLAGGDGGILPRPTSAMYFYVH